MKSGYLDRDSGYDLNAYRNQGYALPGGGGVVVPDPVLYWPLDEPGSPFYDVIAGVTMNKRFTVNAGTAGVRNTCISGGPAAGYIYHSGGGPEWEVGQAGEGASWVVWIRRTSGYQPGQNAGILELGAGANEWYMSLENTTGKLIGHVQLADADELSVMRTEDLNDGNWHQVAMTFNPVDFKLRVYADDLPAVVSTAGRTGALHTYSGSLYLGIKAGDAAFWSGPVFPCALDEFRIFNECLSDEQVLALYVAR